MIEEGKVYKLKKIRGCNNNTECDCKILKIVPSENKQLGDIALYELPNGQRYVAPVSEFIDPENPEEYSSNIFLKLESVMKPMNLTFWKDLKEEVGGMVSASAVSGGTGAAPTPALGQVTGGNISGCMVNGVPVAGKSVKKKKKSKKNEVSFAGLVIDKEQIDNFDILSVKEYFKQNIQQQEVYVPALQDNVKIVGKTWSKTENRIGKDVFFLLFMHLDYLLETSQGINKPVANNKVRNDNIKEWYYLYNTVLFGSQLIKIKMDIAVDEYQNKLYYVRTPKTETIPGTPLSEFFHSHVGRNIISNNIIYEHDEKINPYDLIPGKEYDLTPYFHITLLENNKKNESIETEFTTKVTPQEMIEAVEDGFSVDETLETTINNNREIIKVSVYYCNPEDRALMLGLKLEFLDIDDSVIDEVIEEDLTINDCKDELIYLFSTHKAIDGELYENIDSIVNKLLKEDWEDDCDEEECEMHKEIYVAHFETSNGIKNKTYHVYTDSLDDSYNELCNYKDDQIGLYNSYKELKQAMQDYSQEIADQKGSKLLSIDNLGEDTEYYLSRNKFESVDENFLEEYEDITELIAKQLDRLNFTFANTEDIIYKKEGEYKYLIKFDNELGTLKFKVSKDQNVIFEKQYQIENEEDVNNAFEEIEEVYNKKGI